MQEIELKLRIKQQDIEKLRSHPLLKPFQTTYSKKNLRTAYFDTPDLHLQQLGYALRIRQIGEEYWQTIKNQGTVKNGLHSRQEWEQRISSDSPDFEILPSEIKEVFSAFFGELTCIFVTHFERSSWQLHFAENTEIELALDQGHILCGEKWNEPILEVELEIKRGNEMGLIQLAQILKQTISLKPFDTSKAERGYRLYHLSQCNE